MKNKTINYVFIFTLLFIFGCKIDKNTVRSESRDVPKSFGSGSDTTTIASLNWKTYFNDANLNALIDSALNNNQELAIFLQEIEINKNEIKARKGEYLPFLNFRGGSAVEKSGEYTRNGAVDEQLEIMPHTSFPKPFSDYMFGAYATWEIDVWKKLRNAKKSAYSKYLASIEGKNFLVTNLVAEIASSYYELMALDNLLEIIESNIEIQVDVLSVVQQQKASAKVTQLAVNRFQAQLLNTQNLRYEVKQKIVEAENHISFLTGKIGKPIGRSFRHFQ